jgi:hypothetical protein
MVRHVLFVQEKARHLDSSDVVFHVSINSLATIRDSFHVHNHIVPDQLAVTELINKYRNEMDATYSNPLPFHTFFMLCVK